MERLTPLELEKTQFRRALRGYDRAHVEEVRARAVSEIEGLLRELRTMREMADRALSDLERYRAQESVLTESIVLAQKAADEIRAAAHREAEATLHEARNTASDIRREAHVKLNEMRWEMEKLSVEKKMLQERLRSLLERQLALLDESGAVQPALVHWVPDSSEVLEHEDEAMS